MTYEETLEACATKELTPLGSSYFNLRPSVGVYQVISPIANVRGAILRSISIISYLNWIQLYAGTVPPSGIFDNDSFLLFSAHHNTAENCYSNILIPPGFGVYLAVRGRSGYDATSITFDIL